MNTAKTRVVGASLLIALATGCAEPVPVKNPTWEADVYPILQGQCLHCHGGEAKEKGNEYRFDFRDLAKCGDLGFVEPPKFELPTFWTLSIKFDDNSRATMPPVPASLLEDWEVQTLRNYAKIYKNESSRGSRSNSRNSNPKIVITSRLPDKVGNELKVSYRFEDADGDPVVGVLKLGDAKVDLLKFSGEVTIPNVTGTSGDKLTLTADICDGWEKVTDDNVGEVERE